VRIVPQRPVIRPPKSSISEKASRRRPVAVLVLLLSLGASTTRSPGQDAPVEISGGRNDDGSFYTWVVHNHSDSPICYVEFPHYHADLWIVPEGWKKEATNLAGVPGPKAAESVARTWKEDPELGIPPGGSARFRLRTGRREIYRGRGTVTVRLANGTELKIKDVEVPSAPSRLDLAAAPIALGVLFVAFVIFHTARRKRAARRNAG
jgi:hypothetical protein